MAEPTANIDTTNPSEVARETLRRRVAAYTQMQNTVTNLAKHAQLFTAPSS